MKRETASSRLRAAAQMRIEQYFLLALAETGDGLPSEVVEAVGMIINGGHKTFRYMLLTGLLASVTDRSLHPRCLQRKANVDGAYDARSLCQKVIVPFEKKMLNGRLGASNEPFANKSARYPMIEKTNDVRSGSDRRELNALYDVLEYVRLGDDDRRRKVFCYALALIGKLPPGNSSVTVLPPLESATVDTYSFFDFFEAASRGVSAVAVLAAYFREFFAKDTVVKVHPSTESGASSREVGDIDLEFSNGKRFAIEVKDKVYTDVDVNHACEKALAAGVPKVVFAAGSRAERVNASQGALMDAWAERGVELTFLKIGDLLGVAMAISDRDKRYSMARHLGNVLDDMNAPQEVKDLFARTFKKESR